MSLLCGTPGGSVDSDATRVTTRDPGRNEALWITARAEKCLWIGQGIPVLLTGKLLEGLVAVPVGGGRARAGLEIDRSEPQARVWRSRGRAAAHRHTQRPGSTGVEGAWKTRGATSNMRDHAGPPPTGTSSSLNLQGRVMKPPNPSGGERLHAATYQTARAGKSSCSLVSRTWEGPGIRRRTRGRRSPPRPRPTRYLPRSCGAGCRWTLPRRPGTRRGCAS